VSLTEIMNEWIRIQSWHVVRNWTRVPGRAVTMCGRSSVGDTAFLVRDGGQLDLDHAKPCKTCWRFVVKDGTA